MTNTEWRDIPGYFGKYQVSDTGLVRNSKGLILKPNSKSPRYHTVRLYCGGRNNFEDRLIHRLVAETFLGYPGDQYEVNHIDGNRYNNDISNLEWITHTENMKHGVRLGLVTTDPAKDAHKKSVRCSNGEVYNSIQEAADELGLLPSCISSVLSGRYKTTGGYTFELL